MIEVKNLRKDYGSHHALKGISFSLEEGQIVGLLGPNGAGKSTTMNIMTGYISATSGTVSIGGYDMMNQPEKAKKLVGYLPEIPPVYPDMTVTEYLDFVCELKGIRKKTEKKEEIARVIKEVHVDEVAGRLIRNLSKGYRQRVGLAQALIGNPPVLILDEPTVGLDPKQILEIRELVRTLGENHTVIISSHILPEVQEVCDYILIIDQGRLVAQERSEHLSEHMEDQNQLVLTAKGARDNVEEILRNSDLVREYHIDNETEETVDVKVVSASDQDIRDNLFFEFAEKKIPIIKMEMESMSLEDVFMKLTGQEGSSESPEDTEEESIEDTAEESPEDTAEELPEHTAEESIEDMVEETIADTVTDSLYESTVQVETEKTTDDAPGDAGNPCDTGKGEER